MARSGLEITEADIKIALRSYRRNGRDDDAVKFAVESAALPIVLRELTKQAQAIIKRAEAEPRPLPGPTTRGQLLGMSHSAYLLNERVAQLLPTLKK